MVDKKRIARLEKLYQEAIQEQGKRLAKSVPADKRRLTAYERYFLNSLPDTLSEEGRPLALEFVRNAEITAANFGFKLPTVEESRHRDEVCDLICKKRGGFVLEISKEEQDWAEAEILKRKNAKRPRKKRTKPKAQ